MVGFNYEHSQNLCGNLRSNNGGFFKLIDRFELLDKKNVANIYKKLFISRQIVILW